MTTRTHGESRAIDLIVQAATVELFGLYDVAVAPVSDPPVRPRGSKVSGLVVGAVAFTGDGFNGQLFLAVTPDVSQATSRTQGKLFQAEGDWVKELTSQLMGRIKSRLARFGIVLRVGLPAIAQAGPASVRPASQGERIDYAFRTLRGDVLVTLAGEFAHERLSYARAARQSEAPDVIIF